MAETIRDQYVDLNKRHWASLVRFSFLCPQDRLVDEIAALAHRTNQNSAHLARKVEAILYSRAMGKTEKAIVELGQRATLSDRRKCNDSPGRERHREISWRVSVSLAEAIKPKDSNTIEEVESLQSRLIRVLRIKTHDEMWDFINSHFLHMSDEEMKNCGGIIPPEKDAVCVDEQ